MSGSCVRPRLADLRAQLAAIRRERARLDAAEASIIRAMDAITRDPAHPDFAVADAELVRAGLSQRDANRVIARSATLDAAPAFDAALACGAITAGHVDALASGLGKLSEPDKVRLLDHHDTLLANAERLSVDEFAKHMKVAVARAQSDGGLARFEKQRRSTYLRTWNDPDGMIHLRGAFDPERGSILLSRLDQRVEAIFHSGDRDIPVETLPGIEPNDHRRALALIDLASRPVSGNDETNDGAMARPTRAEVIVNMSLDALRGRLDEMGRLSHGVDIPAETVRRLACEADIIPVVLDGQGVPLDVGRAKRLATSHQRRALATIHDTCAFPGCVVKFAHTEPHHLVPWEHGGPTNLHNLVPLCSRHHHAVHEGGIPIWVDPVTRHVSIAITGPPGHDT
ncbi:MAG: hypothetical protein RIU67_152 [Actinomycetota bacterium]